MEIHQEICKTDELPKVSQGSFNYLPILGGIKLDANVPVNSTGFPLKYCMKFGLVIHHDPCFPLLASCSQVLKSLKPLPPNFQEDFFLISREDFF